MIREIGKPKVTSMEAAEAAEILGIELAPVGDPVAPESKGEPEKPEELSAEVKEERLRQSITDKAIAAAKKEFAEQLKQRDAEWEEKISKLSAPKTEHEKALAEIADLGLTGLVNTLKGKVEREEVSEEAAEVELAEAINRAKADKRLGGVETWQQQQEKMKVGSAKLASMSELKKKLGIEQGTPLEKLADAVLSELGINVNDPSGLADIPDGRLAAFTRAAISDAKVLADSIKAGTSAVTETPAPKEPKLESAGSQRPTAPPKKPEKPKTNEEVAAEMLADAKARGLG